MQLKKGKFITHHNNAPRDHSIDNEVYISDPSQKYGNANKTTSDNAKALLIGTSSDSSCNIGMVECQQQRSIIDSDKFALKTLSSVRIGIGELSVAEQSRVDNILMHDVSFVNAQECMSCTDGEMKQMGISLQQPITRAKAKSLAGGHHLSSHSQ